MPAGDQADERVLNKSHGLELQTPRHHNSVSGKRTGSTISTRSQRRSPSPPIGSETPLTPDDSPELWLTRKRNASVDEAEDTEDKDTETYPPALSRGTSGDSAAQVCICQPDPKIPRPRNAFILYRQHHQASVVAKNPGLANPEISKIIGEQWRNQSPEIKDEWKALAEEEKLRHQQQYPSYRYQPKRNGRRNSFSSDAPTSGGNEKVRCAKCGGRTILAASTSFANRQTASASPSSIPRPSPTPGSTTTPTSRTIPPLRDLNLQSPATRRMGRPHQSNMALVQIAHHDDRDEVGPLSPQNKRRRFEGDAQPTFSRVMHPRYSIAHAPSSRVAPGPSTPFPFPQMRPQTYPSSPAHDRRETLPAIRRVVSPTAVMAPPPRPGMGYQQHRLSQGHMPDRSLTLPPLQTNNAGPPVAAVATSGEHKTAQEVIMSMPVQYKIKILGQISPPTPPSPGLHRGLLIVVEGDTPAAAQELSKWLSDALGREDGRLVTLLEGPDVTPGKSKAMAQYHRLVADWVERSEAINESLVVKRSSVDTVTKTSTDHDTAMFDATPSTAKAVEENVPGAEVPTQANLTVQADDTERKDNNITSAPGVQEAHRNSSSPLPSGKLVTIIPNYSYHASNVFACRIPITDAYSPSDHWQWAATQWRNTAAPDLTIFVRDGLSADTAKQSGGLEMIEELRLFTIKRTRVEGKDGLEVEPSVLRRLGFEVSERIMASTSGGGENMSA